MASRLVIRSIGSEWIAADATAPATTSPSGGPAMSRPDSTSSGLPVAAPNACQSSYARRSSGT